MSPHAGGADPALSIALALAAGIVAQALARHVRVPGIVLLLGTGVILGPDLLDIIRPADLGDLLQTLVGFAVAVILFEGGLNLDWRRLRREARSIQQLVTLGALVTAVGGALAARGFLGWDWTRSILFGTLVIVTGPTVINPLLRRIRLKRSVATVLEAEGILIDAVGAITAVVALEVLISPRLGEVSEVAWELVSRLGFGALAGLVAGGLITLLLRFDGLVPEGLENVFTLSLVLAVFQVSNSIMTESGIMTVTVAGIVVGNFKNRALTDLREFKEQLTVLLIGMLFVLLAADVRLTEVQELGWPGVLTVATLMLIVRPLNVLIGTAGSDLKPREKVFLSWLAPRGIVAAAISSLFAEELEAVGIAGGDQLRALVFLVIAATVLIQGLSGGMVAQLLGLRRPTNSGYAILGASPVALELASLLEQKDHDVILVDSNPNACSAAQEAGHRVLFGNVMSERILYQAELEGRAGTIALTSNDEVNFLFSRRARDHFKVPEAWLALKSDAASVTAEMVEQIGAAVLFGKARSIDLWNLRLERDQARVECWVRQQRSDRVDDAGGPTDLDKVCLPLAIDRGSSLQVYDGRTDFKKGDSIYLVIADERRDEAEAWLTQKGWEPRLASTL